MLLAGVLTAAAGWWVNRQTTAVNAAPSIMRCDLPTQAADTPHPGMVWVPPGRLAMGDTVYPEEQPVRMVTLPGFWISRTEVSNAQFAAFVLATAYVTVAERPVDPALHAALPNAAWVVIPNSGHLPMEEAPAAFNAALLAYLAEVGE